MAETRWQCQGQGEMAASELSPRVIQGPTVLIPGGRNGVSAPQL